jgi:aminopeptidase N
MLRALTGNDKFWAGIREYYRRYRDGNASTGEFRKVMEETSDADLSWFFQQWLHRGGSPVVEGSWRYNAEIKRVEIELAQTQTGDAYRLPMEVGITFDGVPQVRIEKIELTRKDGRFEFAAEKEPALVVLDPNTWLLMETRFVKRTN